MGAQTTLLLLAVLLIVGFIFYEEISTGVSAFSEDRAQADVEKELEIEKEAGQELCDLVITFYGEIEHQLFSLPTILRFEFGSNTNHPEVAVWDYKNCGLTTATLIPRLGIYLSMIQEDQTFDELTSDELTALNISPQQLDLINVGSTSYNMQIKIIDADDTTNFRACGTSNPDLCRVIVLPSGVVPEPYEFQKTFIIKKIPKQDYIIEITIKGQKINNLSANAPYGIFLDLNNQNCLTPLRIAGGDRTTLDGGSPDGSC